MADDDPSRLDALERLPIMDYWHLLNRKLAAAERLRMQQKKNIRSATSHR